MPKCYTPSTLTRLQNSQHGAALCRAFLSNNGSCKEKTHRETRRRSVPPQHLCHVTAWTARPWRPESGCSHSAARLLAAPLACTHLPHNNEAAAKVSAPEKMVHHTGSITLLLGTRHMQGPCSVPGGQQGGTSVCAPDRGLSILQKVLQGAVGHGGAQLL